MRKRISACLALLLSLLLAVNVWADEPGHEQRPDYSTDYYMIVESTDGGIDIYSNAGTDNSKLNNQPIPNGTALHIEGEKKGDDGKEWGYTEYHGMYGYVPMDDLKPSTLSEAVDSEVRLGGAEEAEYDVEVDADHGSTPVYKGPGQKFGEVTGAEEIPNGKKLHITKEMEAEDGSHWGMTATDDAEGWVDLGDTNWDEKYGEKAEAADTQGGNEAAAANITPVPLETAAPTPSAAPAATPTAKPTAVPTAKPTATPTVKPTATPKVEEAEDPAVKAMAASEPTPTTEPTAAPTKEPEATPTEKPESSPTEKPAATPTKEAEPTAKPTETATPTEAVTPTEKAKETATPEAEPTEKLDKVQDASSKDVKASNPWYKSPVVWGTAGGMLLVVLILLYFLKKKK